MTAAMGGFSALPVGAVITVANLVGSALTDEDEPWDAETELRAGLRSLGGDHLETLVMRGAFNAATGMDMSGRISLDSLILRTPDRQLDGREMSAYYMEQLAGPVVGGIGSSLFRGVGMLKDGHAWRGLETLSPKFVRDISRAARYGSQGVRNMRGDVVVDSDLFSAYSDDLNWWNILWQAQGFTPDKVKQQYQDNTDLKNYEGHIKDKRSQILSGYYLATVERDRSGLKHVMQRVKEFNRSNPGYQIDDKTLSRSLKTRLRYTKESLNGVAVTKSLRYLAEELNM